MSEQVHDLTSVVTPENPETRQKIEKGLAIVAIASTVILLVNFQVKRFTAQKHVKLVVADKPAS